MHKGNSIVALILLIFFVISLLQNMLGPLIPNIIDDFSLRLTLAGFLPFSFFIAYAVMFIPAGFLIEKFRGKAVLLVAFFISFAGAILFATNANFTYALFSLFLLGAGVAMIQVGINPLLRVAGGEKHFAFNSVLAQFIFGLASFLSPKLYIYFVQNLQDVSVHKNVIITLLSQVVPDNLPWISLFWVFAILTLLMIVPVIICGLGNMFGLRVGMIFLYITLGYILSIGFWAKPLISNETIMGKRDAAKLLAKDNG
jgi:fucose permease